MNLISDTYTNRTYRPFLAGTSIVLLAIALLLMSFDDYWEPVAIQFLQRHESVAFLSSFVPYLSLIFLFLGGGLGIKAKEAPLDTSGNGANRDLG
jgi:cell division protein FtsX